MILPPCGAFPRRDHQQSCSTSPPRPRRSSRRLQKNSTPLRSMARACLLRATWLGIGSWKASCADDGHQVAFTKLAYEKETIMACTFTWGGYADTDLDFNDFVHADHTVAVRFMLQYPHAYTGPMLSVKGTGTYLLGQGDFLGASPGGQVKLVLKLGTDQMSYAVDLPAGTWHHLAVVRSRITSGPDGIVFQMYLDGQAVGAPLKLPASDLPVGKMRFGKNTLDPAVVGGGAQFYGLLDDVAVFKNALSASRIAQLANSPHLSGSEEDLYAGYTFGYVPAGGLPAKLARP